MKHNLFCKIPLEVSFNSAIGIGVSELYEKCVTDLYLSIKYVHSYILFEVDSLYFHKNDSSS